MQRNNFDFGNGVFSCLADGGNEGFHRFEVWVLHEIGDTPLSRVVTTDAARLSFE
jgi:hypothetical protein